MVWVLAFDRLTVKGKAVVPGGVLLVVPSGLTTSSMESAGWVSSFWIVPVPTALAIVALVAPDRVTVKVSSGSNAVSAHTSTPPGTTAFAFTVSLSNASSQTITVNYGTGNVTAIGNARAVVPGGVLLVVPSGLTT